MALSCPLWYVTCLFCTLIYYWIIKHFCKNSKKSVIAICWLCTFISYGLNYFGIHKLPWNVDTAFMAVFFVMIGDYLHSRSITFVKTLNKVRIRLPPLALLVCVGFTGIEFNKIEWMNCMWNDYGNYFLMIIGAVSVNISLYIVFQHIDFENKIGTMLSKIGQHTLFILGFEYTTGRIARLILPGSIQNCLTVYLLKLLILFIVFIIWSQLLRMVRNERIRKHLLKY